MDVLLIRLEAPLISFGAPVVDAHGVIQDFPALSMITGLVANALGFDHSEFERLQRLQQRVTYAVRRDRPGERVQDYQTVDLGQEFMRESHGWTTHGELHGRGKNKAATGTHIRYRDYWADAAYTVALRLEPPEEAPTLSEVSAALSAPERPLFIGRKTCLPARPLNLGTVVATTPLDALRNAPLAAGGPESTRRHAWWEVAPDERVEAAMKRPVNDARDWKNQIHVGERWIAHGDIDVTQEVEHV